MTFSEDDLVELMSMFQPDTKRLIERDLHLADNLAGGELAEGDLDKDTTQLLTKHRAIAQAAQKALSQEKKELRNVRKS